MFLMGAAAWTFLEIQNEVRSGALLAYDERILLFFREPGSPEILRGPAGLEDAVRDFTSLGGRPILTLITLATTGFLLLRRQFGPLLLLWIVVIGGYLLMGELKTFFDRTRPEGTLRLSGETSPSFPSGHAMMSTMIYMTLAVIAADFQEGRRTRFYLIGFAAFLAALIGLTRVILGAHFPSDVVAGWTLGLVWTLLCWMVAHWLRRYRAESAKQLPCEKRPD
jgi:undecaprenyl-diphosphatase